MARPLRSSAVLTLALSIVAASCGGSLSLSDYADEVEALVSTMNGAIDDAEREWRAAPPSVDATQKFHAHRVEARKTFVVALEALEPPETVAEFHAIALNLLGRLRDAEIAMAERADSIQTMEEMSTLWDGPEGHAFQEIDAEAIAFCQAAQVHFDATESGAALRDTPFIPPEMQEVVRVAFRCIRVESSEDP